MLFRERGHQVGQFLSRSENKQKMMMIFNAHTPLKKTATVVCEISVAFIPSEVGEDTESKICDCNFSYCNCYVVRRIIFNLKN